MSVINEFTNLQISANLPGAIERIVPNKAFLRIIKRDINLAYVSLNRKILFSKNREENMDLYLMPLISLYPGKVIYVSQKDERNSWPQLKDMMLFSPTDLPHVSDFTKVNIFTDSTGIKPLKNEMQNIYNFIINQADNETLVIIDETSDIMAELVPDIVKNGPAKCFIIFHSEEQLKTIYQERKIRPEKELVKNFWAVIDMSDFTKFRISANGVT